MSGPAPDRFSSLLAGRRFTVMPLLAGVAAAAALAFGAFFAPKAAAEGWRIAFIAWSGASIGAVALALIHALTGGRWGEACQPTLRAGALCAALLPLFFLPILAASGHLYPWAHDPASLAPDVARRYLNPPAFALRGLVALFGWAIIGAFAASGRLSLLAAALALVFHGVAISLVAFDWTLSSDPNFTDSSFGAEMAVQQILTALAAVALLEPRRAVARAGGDVAGLLFATALGALYLAMMTFIVKWYGDQTPDAAWYLARAEGPWLALLLATLALGAAAPILVLAWERARRSVTALRAVGGATLAGVALHDFWLVRPDSPAMTAIATALAFIAMAGLSIGLGAPLGRLIAKRRPSSHAREAADDV